MTADDALASQMLVLIQIVVKHIGSRLEQVGLTTTDYFTLQALDDPVPMSELANRMNYDPSYVTALADKLEELGLVERQLHTTDRRVRNLALTERGRKVNASLPDTLWSGADTFSALTAA
jgi:DNA-binding MarR family transcriptional regulator